jgi:hypothetical protein
MSMTRRTACKSLLLAPLAGLSSGCPDLVGEGGIPLDIYAKNENVENAKVVFSAWTSPTTGGLDILGRGLSAGQEVLKSADHVTFPFTANVLVNGKVIVTKSVDENFITNNGARTFAESQLTLLAYCTFVKGKLTNHGSIIAEAAGTSH